jgi:putative transposase
LKNIGGELLLKINQAIKMRIYPTGVQQEMLNKTFGCCRLLWNQMLAERNEVYQLLKENSEVLREHKYKTEKEYKMEFKFMKEVDSKALQSTTQHLLEAFNNFFRSLKETRKVGYPKFKSKRNKQSYTTYNINANIKIDFTNKRIKLPKLKTWIKYRDDRTFAEPIRQVTVSKTKNGKYFVAILIEKELDITPMIELREDLIGAFDMSASEFLVGESEDFCNPRFYRSSEAKLKRLHRQLSRKKKGSQNRWKARLRLARYYEKILNQKYDWVHKTTFILAKKYDAVILEDLNIQGMQQFNSGLSKSVSLDFSWHQFKTILKYKLEWRGKYYQEVGRFFPSSKLCSICGYKNKSLELAEREWVCPECSAHHLRDENASINLKKEGIRFLQEKGIIILT